MNGDLDLYDLNLTYLLKAQKMALEGKARQASLVLGLAPEELHRLPELPIETLRMMARSGLLCYQSRLPRQLWRDLQNAGMDEETLTARIQMSILGGD